MVIRCDIRSVKVEICEMLARILETLVKEISRRARGRDIAKVEGVVAGVGGCMMKMMLLLLLVVQTGDLLVRLWELRARCAFKVAVAVWGWMIWGIDGLKGLEGGFNGGEKRLGFYGGLWCD